MGDELQDGAPPTDAAPQDIAPSRHAERALDEQRAEHERPEQLPQHETNEEGVGALVNNTGDDGGAASG